MSIVAYDITYTDVDTDCRAGTHSHICPEQAHTVTQLETDTRI